MSKKLGRCATSNSKDWCTPPRIINAVRKFFGGSIDLDPCSNSHSSVGAEHSFVPPTYNGLALPWDIGNHKVFVNPPYGRDSEHGSSIYDWVKKCSDSYTECCCEVIALIPVATNTAHWKEYVFPTAAAICFLKDTRLKFYENGMESKKGAPMACALVYWGTNSYEFDRVFETDFGNVVYL